VWLWCGYVFGCVCVMLSVYVVVCVSLFSINGVLNYSVKQGNGCLF